MGKVFFLIINEDLYSGLIQEQVILPIKKHLIDTFEPVIINFHRLDKEGYKDEQLKVINIPLLIPYKLFLFNWLFFLTPIIAFTYAFVLSFIVSRKDVIVGRSYFPGLVSMILKKLKQTEYIFDSRSLFIDEHAERIRSINRFMWKKMEKNILKKSKKNISVSEYQRKYYDSLIEEGEKNVVVHCFYDIDKILSENEIFATRLKFGIKEDDIVVCYFGSLNQWWNNISMYKKVFLDLAEEGKKVLIISQDHKNVDLNNDNIIIIDTDKCKEFNDLIQISDYGIVLLEKNLDWKSRLTVKFAAYTRNGIPSIVGKYVGEAVRITKEEKIKSNIIVDYENITKEIVHITKTSSVTRSELVEIGKKYFSSESIQRYLT